MSQPDRELVLEPSSLPNQASRAPGLALDILGDRNFGSGWWELPPRTHPNVGAGRVLNWLEFPATGFACVHHALRETRDPLIPDRPPGARVGGGGAKPFVGIGWMVWVLPMAIFRAGWTDHARDVA